MPTAASLNYTPPAAGNCQVTVTTAFDAQTGQAIDFGASCSYRIVCAQGGNVFTSQVQQMGRARARYVIDWSVAIAPSVPCTFSLEINAGATVTIWNCIFKAEIVKR